MLAFLLMGTHTVLVLTANLADKELALLEQLPPETNLAVGTAADAFERLADEADVIFNWSASGKLLREVFLMCPKVRWVHSRSAGLMTKIRAAAATAARAARCPSSCGPPARLLAMEASAIR